MEWTEPAQASLQSRPALAFPAVQTVTATASQLIPTGQHPPNSAIQTLPSGTINHIPHSTLSRGFSSWYRNESPTQWLDPAKEAFDNAVAALNRDLSPSDCDFIWLRGKNSMTDVQNALVEAQAKYQSLTGKSKTRSLLANCSSRVSYYAPIFDTLSQHYPEYVSLAWGAFKFFFTVMINHEELLAEFARAIANIANVLPRTKLLCELYPIKEMQNGVANVYAKIIEFVLETVKWYKMSKLQHIVSAVVNPYKLSFKAIVDEIAERSTRVDELANTAFKAEIRDVHLQVGTLYEENLSLRSEMLGMRNELLMMHDQVRIMSRSLIDSQMLQSQIAFNQQGQNLLLLEWQTENLRLALESAGSGYGSADEMLTFGRSIRNRRRLRTPTQMPGAEISKLENWASGQYSSVLVAQGNGFKSSSMDFAVDFLDAIIEARAPIVWALPLAFSDSPMLTSILQSLVLQVLSLNSNNSPGTEPHSISTQDLRCATSVAQWFDILHRSFRRVERLFVIIDVDLIQRSRSAEDAGQNGMGAEQFIDRLRAMVAARRQGWLKVVLVSWSSDVFEHFESDPPSNIFRVFTDRGVVQERKFWNPRLRGMARRQVKLSSHRFRMAVGLPARNLGSTGRGQVHSIQQI